MKLTKYEKETIILFNEAEDQVDVFTYNVNLKRRLANFSRKYPELCRKKAVNKEGGVTYLIDKGRLSIHLVPPYDAERIERGIKNSPLRNLRHTCQRNRADLTPVPTAPRTELLWRTVLPFLRDRT